MKKFFQDNPDLFDTVEFKVREAVGLLPPATEEKEEKKGKK